MGSDELIFVESFEGLVRVGIDVAGPAFDAPKIMDAFMPRCRQPGCGRSITFSPIANEWWHTDNGARHCWSPVSEFLRKAAPILGWKILDGRPMVEDPDRVATNTVTYKIEMGQIGPGLMDVLLGNITKDDDA